MQGKGHRWPVPGPLVAAIVLAPLAAGLLGTLLPAFGVFPGAGGGPSLAAWRALAGWPGLAGSLALTLRTGLLATALSLATALALAVAARRAGILRAVAVAAPPLLAVPHAAVAVGLAFLVAPSGLLARLASPWLTGWTSPPDLAVVHDRLGLALVGGLWLKETPFLLLAILAALAQARAEASLRAAAALGYGPWRGWALVLLPLVWRQIRLPLLAVLVFSLSVVDVALILGPGAPPPFAVQLLRWFADPDLSRWPVACAGALLLAAMAPACCAAVLLLERLAGWIGRRLARSGRRGAGGAAVADGVALASGAGLLAAALGGLLVLALWAGAGSWVYPATLPRTWSVAAVAGRWAGLGHAGPNTLAIALAATLLALLLSVAVLRGGAVMPRWAYLPLLVPQPALLWGQQVVLVRLGLDGGALALVWSHLQFVLPYVLLALAGPFRAVDLRHARAAASLGASPLRVLLRVTVPLLLRPLLAAAAIGVAVSVGLYLPTLFAGAGRVATLATETVALASGADRRLAAAAALAQAAMPLLAFAFALGVPSLVARRRRGVSIAR